MANPGEAVNVMTVPELPGRVVDDNFIDQVVGPGFVVADGVTDRKIAYEVVADMTAELGEEIDETLIRFGTAVGAAVARRLMRAKVIQATIGPSDGKHQKITLSLKPDDISVQLRTVEGEE